MIFDITPEVSPSTATFPGDVAFTLNYSKNTQQGDSYSLSSFQTTTHIGAHADAPVHYSKSSETIDGRNLNYYLGKCQVIDVPQGPLEVSVDQIKDLEIKAPRVLFKTGSVKDFNKWQDDFSYLSTGLVEYLASKKVITVGIDTPSVDAASSASLDAHQAIARNDMAILEGLDLSKAAAGVYELIALPLKLKGADASPVRAILRSI